MEGKEKDYLNPEDFDELFEDESTDGKEDEIENDEDESTDSTDDENAKAQKSKEEEQKKKNSEFARRRREKEEAERLAKEEKLKNQAKVEAQLEILKVNPFTQEKIEDEEDLKIYKIQKELDDEGLDPISDLPKRLAEIKRKEKQESSKKTEEEAKLKEKINQDLDDFRKKYPKVDTKALSKDEDFLKFAYEGDKVGRWTTAEIYEMYNLKKGNSANDDAMKNKEVEEVTNKMSKNPSSNPSGRIPNKSIENLDPNNPEDREAFKKHWNKTYGG